MNPTESVTEWIERLRSNDDAVRGPAWQGAGPLGAAAVRPLAEVLAGGDVESARAAKRALWKVVYHAGRPHGESERRAVEHELLAALSSLSGGAGREILWMLSVVGKNEAVANLEPLLRHGEWREDARCALQRIPGRRATDALKRALAAETGDFAEALAEALRARGQRVEQPASRKRVPSRQTAIGV